MPAASKIKRPSHNGDLLFYFLSHSKCGGCLPISEGAMVGGPQLWAGRTSLPYGSCHAQEAERRPSRAACLFWTHTAVGAVWCPCRTRAVGPGMQQETADFSWGWAADDKQIGQRQVKKK